MNAEQTLLYVYSIHNGVTANSSGRGVRSAHPRAVLFSWGKRIMCGKFSQTQFNHTEITSPNYTASDWSPALTVLLSVLPSSVKSGKWEGKKRRFIIDVFPWNSPSSPQHRLTLRWKKSFKIFLWDNIRRVCLGEPIKSLPCYRSVL